MGNYSDLEQNFEGYNLNPDKLLGTEDYMAPEILLDDLITQETDYWALGVMIYELFSNTLPFKTDSTLKTFENIKQVKINWEDFEDKSKDSLEGQDVNISIVINLIKKFLVFDKEQRWSSKNIEEIKRHEFFSNFNWTTVNKTRDPVVIQHVNNKIKELKNRKPIKKEDNELVKEKSSNNFENSSLKGSSFYTERIDNLNERNFMVIKNNIRQKTIDINGSDLKLIDIMNDLH